MAQDLEKALAARESMRLVRDGMVIGLGSGSTSMLMIRELARTAAEQGWKGIRGVPTSERSAALARELGIPLVDLNDVDRVDLAIDGADEIAPGLSLIKGGGGALLREKIVAAMADEFVVIADSTKLVPVLGTFPLPVEVIPFGWKPVRRALEGLGLDARLREQSAGTAFETDQRNYVLDCQPGLIRDPQALAISLKSIPGVVDHGLFLGIARRALVAIGEHVEEIT